MEGKKWEKNNQNNLYELMYILLYKCVYCPRTAAILNLVMQIFVFDVCVSFKSLSENDYIKLRYVIG